MTVTATGRARVSRRAAAVSPSATLAIDAQAKALKAAGEDVVVFGAGEPDFPTPAYIVEAAAEACRDPRNHKYTPTAGLPELREAISAKTKRDSGLEVQPGQVVVTNGGKHAVAQAFEVLLDAGDEVLVPAPYWTTYPEAVKLAGGEAIPVPTDESTGFMPTVDALMSHASERTKVLLFVSPSNPTGGVATLEQISEIGQLALAENWWVITDEIYEHLVYEGRTQHSLPAVVPELQERCVVLNGVAKTYAMTGWRVGWMIAPPDVAAAAANVQSHVTSNVNNVAQRAALAALGGGLDAVAEMRAVFDRRRRLIVSLLDSIDGISCPVPYGAFYAFPNLSGLLGREMGGGVARTSAELASLVLEKAKVAFVPGEAFGAPGYGRFSYALSDEDIVRGLARLAELAGESPGPGR